MSEGNSIVTSILCEMLSSVVDISNTRLLQLVFSSPLSDLSSMSPMSTVSHQTPPTGSPVPRDGGSDSSVQGPADDPLLAALVASSSDLPSEDSSVTPVKREGQNGVYCEPRRLFDGNNPNYYGGEKM
jgi:hypothetical protein